MKDIPMYVSFKTIQKIDKGMSGDEKYYIETAESERLLLRIADIEEFERRQSEYERAKSMYALGVPMSAPIDFGICSHGKNVYTLLSWIDGEEVEAVLPGLPQKAQYELGLESGRILRGIHALPAPAGIEDWSKRYFSVIDERLDAFRREGVSFEGSDMILSYLENNRFLLQGRPQVCHHGDYHMGNLIQFQSGLYVIDWHMVDFDNYGDPWYEFNRIGVEWPFFASGQIDGYFNGEIPQEFWKLLAFYLSASAITSIVWAKYFAPGRLHSILQLNREILRWFDNMNCAVPTWYSPQL